MSNGRRRYPSGFFARYLRHFVWATMDAHGWRQLDVAKWLGLPDTALSEYLNRHSHPDPDRRRRLTMLGCDERRLVAAEIADKLDAWMLANDVSVEDALRHLKWIEATRRKLPPAARAYPHGGDLVTMAPGECDDCVATRR